jgi:hypothetical protein
VKKQEKSVKDTQLNSKNTELATLISKIITKKREELNQSNIKEFENKTASGGQDERKAMSELFKLKLLLLSIRYLENDGDTTLASSITEENTALTTIEDISSKAIRC